MGLSHHLVISQYYYRYFTTYRTPNSIVHLILSLKQLSDHNLECHGTAHGPALFFKELFERQWFNVLEDALGGEVCGLDIGAAKCHSLDVQLVEHARLLHLQKSWRRHIRLEENLHVKWLC